MSTATDRESANPQPFDVVTSSAILAKACRLANYHADDAELIRLGENAIFHLKREGLVARIARGLDVLADAKKEIRVANWLVSESIGTAAPADIEQPLIVNQHPVTFWRYVENLGTEATTSELGTVLRRLHALEPPKSLELPQNDIFGRVSERIDRACDIPQADRDFLRGNLEDLRSRYGRLTFPLRQSAVHGDAHTGNLLRLPDGATALIDLERFAYGQPETDLIVTAIDRNMGWCTEREYQEFVEAYGFDVTGWDGYPVVRAISELKMTTWLMQNVGHSVAIDEEIRMRLNDLRRPEAPRHWSPF